MENNTVALASLGVLATCVGLMVWVVKKVLNDIAPALNKHSHAADGITEATKKNTQASVKSIEASNEMLVFMKNLNGKLAKATIQTVNEQHVEHQTIQSTEVVQ